MRVEIGVPMGRYGDTKRFSESHDANPFADAPEHAGIRLDNVCRLLFAQLPEFPTRLMEFARGNWGSHCSRNLPLTFHLVRGSRFHNPPSSKVSGRLLQRSASPDLSRKPSV